MADAVVFAGAIMREPFAAGALSALSDPSVRAKFGIDIHRIVATSSGAMSGAFYAAAIQAGQEANAGARLAKLWIEEASFLRTFAPSLRGIVAPRNTGAGSTGSGNRSPAAHTGPGCWTRR